MSTNISLTPELEEYAKGKVAQGLYGSVSELMREALRLLRKQDIEYLLELEADLKKAANEIDAGEVEPFSMQAIIDEADKEIIKHS
ncbi:MAG: type II toxin-antitoxin system ParD family antitoxin [Devosiaceae bacterium]|nr:type II toxin-antitoxin system ParD family antitoxin [Devosiaceae bacterium]